MKEKYRYSQLIKKFPAAKLNKPNSVKMMKSKSNRV